MAKNPVLKTCYTILKKMNYIVKFQDDNALTVYNHGDNVPFLFIISDKTEFHGIILNWAIDFLNVPEAVEIAVNLMHVSPICNGEQFYFSNNGDLFVGDEALLSFDKDNNINPSPLAGWEPDTKVGH